MIPATKKSPIPPSKYSLFLSIIPEAISNTAKNPIIGGSICENNRYELDNTLVILNHLVKLIDLKYYLIHFFLSNGQKAHTEIKKFQLSLKAPLNKFNLAQRLTLK